MKDSIDWYTALRRSALVAFILLTVLAVVQGASLYTVYGHSISLSLSQLGFIVLWPFNYAPVWFKCVYFILAFYLFIVYLWPVDAL